MERRSQASDPKDSEPSKEAKTELSEEAKMLKESLHNLMGAESSCMNCVSDDPQ